MKYALGYINVHSVLRVVRLKVFNSLTSFNKKTDPPKIGGPALRNVSRY